MRNGHDRVVLAETRCSKSFLFQIFPIIKKNVILPVIVQTLALIKDQLQSIKK